MEKVINGFWDGEPIWRYKTAQEMLAEAINGMREINNSQKKWALTEQAAAPEGANEVLV